MEVEQIYEKGCLYLEHGDVEKAFISFNETLKINGEYYPALNKIGVIYANKGELEKAEEYFESCLEVNEEYAPAYVNLANIYKENGKLEEAEAYYRHAIEQDPSYYLSYYNLAVLYKQKNNYGLYMKNMKEYKRLYKQYIHQTEVLKGKKNFMKIRKVGLSLNIFILMLVTIVILVYVKY